MFERDLIARSDLDTAETTFSSNEAALQASKAQVAQQEAAMRLAETNLRYTHIVSPVDGIVVSRAVDVGQTVAASFQTPTLFTIAQDLTKMQIDTSVDEADIGKIQPNQAVDFTVDAYPEATFKGRVDQVRIAPITVQNVVTYDVVIKVDNTDLRLKPGMTANVSIITAEKSGALRVPNAALRFKPANSEGSFQRSARTDGKRTGQPASGVWTQDGKKLKRMSIVPGISDGAYTEVVSGELKEGQIIAVESNLEERLKASKQQLSARHAAVHEMSLIEVIGISKVYNMGEVDLRALDDVSTDRRKWRFCLHHGAVRFGKIDLHEYPGVSRFTHRGTVLSRRG